MSIESLRKRINKKVELSNYKNNFTDIGGFIKERRKKMNVTQDEISNGICSISYLSKIENNQIVPSDFYVKEIMEKLDVDRAIYSKSLKEKEYLNQVIDAIFFMEDDSLQYVYQEIKDIEHNVIINLCKLGYIVYFNLKDDNQYVMMLENLVNNMSNYEAKAYLLFAAMYFIENENFKASLELINLAFTIQQSTDYLDALLSETSYFVKQRLRIKNCSSEDYNNALTIFTEYHNVNRIMSIALVKTNSILKESPSKALKKLKSVSIKYVNQDIKDYYYYLKASIQYKLHHFHDATLSLKKIEENSIYFLRKMTLLLLICSKENDHEMIQRIKEIVEDYHPSKREMNTKIYYHYLIQSSDQDKKEYLRDIAIPFAISTQDYDNLEEYTNNIMDICFTTSWYKEGMQFYKKYQKEMSKVKKIMY